MKSTYLALFVGLAAMLSACRMQDVRTIRISVPAMRNPACTEVVRVALSKLQGVMGERTRFDLKRHTVTVSYDSLLLSLKNVEFAIADAGFAADEVPANTNAVAALPPECCR